MELNFVYEIYRAESHTMSLVGLYSSLGLLLYNAEGIHRGNTHINATTIEGKDNDHTYILIYDADGTKQYYVEQK